MSEIQKVEQIHKDFSQRNGPFTDEMFPEEQLIAETDPQNEYERAMLITAFCTLDYNRDATQLKDNLVTLYEDSSVWFAPRTLTNPDSKYDAATLSQLMDHIGFRYKNRDARGLWKNYEIIAEKYGTVQELLRSCDHDAVKLVERLEDDEFLYLKGVKLAPFYARLMSDNVAALSRVWELDVPVDVHIRRLSHDLFDDGLSDDEIRQQWADLCEGHISPAVVDGALWLIGNRWDDWGETYWEEL